MVELRSERTGRDVRRLYACVEDGHLMIGGQDLGPATASVSGDGEYEWCYIYPPESIPALAAALGGSDGEDILDLLGRTYCGSRSYELERICRDTSDSIPRRFWSG
jgi:hypothetical protein